MAATSDEQLWDLCCARGWKNKCVCPTSIPPLTVLESSSDKYFGIEFTFPANGFCLALLLVIALTRTMFDSISRVVAKAEEEE